MAQAEIQYVTPLLPLWGMVVLVITLVPFAALLGWLVGRRRYVRADYANNPPASLPGDATLGAMLALLGLLLAFTFGFVLSRAEARKLTEVEEAGAIGTAFLRADLLADPGRRDLQEAIGTYARTRLPDDRVLGSSESFDEFLRTSLEAQAVLWPAAMNALHEDTSPAVAVLVANGITEVLDAHSRRLAASLDGVPLVVKLMVLVYAIAALFFVGNHAALRGRRLTWRTFMFSIGVGTVMVVIADFERPNEGFVQTNHAVMKSAIADIDTALASYTGDR